MSDNWQIPRVYLSELTKNPRMIRYLEDLGTSTTTTLPDQIDAAQLAGDQALALANSVESVAIEALANSLSEVQNANNALSSQLAEVLKVIPDDNTGAVQSILAEIAELKKTMKPKRIINASILVAGGALSNTYTISPACDLATTTLNANGLNTSVGIALDSALVSLELTNSTTVTARRGASTGGVTAYFQLVEY